jgi:hypothetical protein
MKATIKVDRKIEIQEKKEQEQENKERGCTQWINKDGTPSNGDMLLNDIVPVHNEQMRVTLNVDTLNLGIQKSW